MFNIHLNDFELYNFSAISAGDTCIAVNVIQIVYNGDYCFNVVRDLLNMNHQFQQVIQRSMIKRE